MTKFQKIILIIISGIIWGLVINFLEPPTSLKQISFIQAIFFFLPIFFTSSLFLNLFIKSFLKSLLISSGSIILLILYALQVLNLLSGSLLIILTILFLKILSRKPARPPKRQARLTKIKKLRSNF